MTKTIIDTAGHWLRADAAASYLRMLACGMPPGGIAALGAGRTYAEQEKLWKAYKAGKGNLAARPGTSRHETGRALDITRGTAAQSWAARGGNALKVSPAETTRAELFGWVRDVPSEPWHFVYFPTLDHAAKLPTLRPTATGPAVKILQLALGLTADGKYGPLTASFVKARQRAAGLVPDAVAGPKTWTALGLHWASTTA